MSSNQILIISDDRSGLQSRLSIAALEKCRMTGLESLRYISFSNLCAVVIDAKSIDNTLRKVSLGIRDDDASDALWQLLSHPTDTRIYFLIDKMQKPGSDMLQLGIGYIIVEHLEQLITDANSENAANGNLPIFSENGSKTSQLLTADDIREMHQQNIRQIPAGSRLTAWASEVADSLNISQSDQDSEQLQLIWPVEAKSSDALKKMHVELFDLNSRYPNLLFLVNPVLLPIFNSLYPALQGKTVSPVIHWAAQGAFTGETSAAMLADMHCIGAVIPACKPYTDPQNLLSLIKQAKENGLILFSTFTLASSSVCDIIASESSDTMTLTPLYMAELIIGNELPTGPAAIVANHELLKQIAFRKGN
ncbi:MAG: hypothetical protein KKB51_23420 [Candidatus Riflebacteria bacterium]|nr:hypothetical protein [Candidatus Riflebacteria bacterium]